MANILCIEDEPQLLVIIRRFLEEAGHAVVAVATGEEGLQVLHEQPVDLVITDILMAEMDGIEMLRRMRQRVDAPPVIAMSGGGNYCDGGDLLTVAHSMGARATLKKPFVRDDLLRVVATVLGVAG